MSKPNDVIATPKRKGWHAYKTVLFRTESPTDAALDYADNKRKGLTRTGRKLSEGPK